MKKLQFSIIISATKEAVWKAMWTEENYRIWASAFQEGACYLGSLETGSVVEFLGPDNNGMYACVEIHQPAEKIHFLHLGELAEGQKIPGNFGSEAIERYEVTETADGTELTATLNAPEEYISFFTAAFPNALHRIKSLAENV